MMLGASKEESIPSRVGESIPGICKEWLASIVVLTTRSLYECGLYGQTAFAARISNAFLLLSLS